VCVGRWGEGCEEGGMEVVGCEGGWHTWRSGG
jgi:hypothetical protein